MGDPVLWELCERTYVDDEDDLLKARKLWNNINFICSSNSYIKFKLHGVHFNIDKDNKNILFIKKK